MVYQVKVVIVRDDFHKVKWDKSISSTVIHRNKSTNIGIALSKTDKIKIIYQISPGISKNQQSIFISMSIALDRDPFTSPE